MGNVEVVSKELKKIPWFHELNKEHIRKIAEITNVRQVKAAEV